MELSQELGAPRRDKRHQPYSVLTTISSFDFIFPKELLSLLLVCEFVTTLCRNCTVLWKKKKVNKLLEAEKVSALNV